jgi:hypothetical protein
MLHTEKITQIATDSPAVYAFRIEDGVSSDEMAAMARLIDGAFDRHDTIRMLLFLYDFRMTDAVRSLSFKSLATQARSVWNVSHYAVVGAPNVAAVMIEAFDKIIPVKASTFDRGEEADAWAFVGASPRDPVKAGQGSQQDRATSDKKSRP